MGALIGACGSVQTQSSIDAGPGGGEAGTADAAVDGTIDGGMVAPPTSCIGLANTCGFDKLDSCCTSPDVPGNTFYRGFDLAVDGDSGTRTLVATLSDFRLDKYEVSVGRFRAFVAAGLGTQNNPPLARSGAHPNIQNSGWDAAWNQFLPINTQALQAQLKCDPDTLTHTWTDNLGNNENRPINCVTWYEAAAFCAWDGGYLPTETEWMYASGGGTDQRAFPWSNPPGDLTLDPTRSSYFDGTNCNGDGLAGCAVTDLIVVGTRPAGNSRWGQSDLAGNVSEWTLDYTGPYASTCNDCANLAVSNTRQLRGGSYTDGKRFERVTFRVGLPPATASPVSGIRCARLALPH